MVRKEKQVTANSFSVCAKKPMTVLLSCMENVNNEKKVVGNKIETLIDLPVVLCYLWAIPRLRDFD